MRILVLLLFTLQLGQGIAQSQQITTVYFDFNSADLSSEATTKLKAFNVTLIDEDVDIKILAFEAHTDSSGTPSYNVRLAKRRLNTVLNYLKIEDVTTRVLGESISSQVAPSNYVDSKFRKVDIIYTESKASPPPKTEVPEPTTLETGISKFIASDEEELSFDLAIHFVPGKWIPLTESYDELNELLRILTEYPNLNADLHGHVCCINALVVSKKRAEFVYLYLVKKGIAEDRLMFEGHGNIEPKAFPEQTEHDRIQNRRVNIVFTKS